MSASAARQIANTENAQRSTGPRTSEGKSHSSQNARKHGLTSQDVVIAAEDGAEFEEMLAGFQSEIQPQGAIQESLFDELVAAAWNLRRVRRMETQLCSGASSYVDLLNTEELQTKLDRLARHKTRIERTFHRALKELKALHTDAVIAGTLPPDMQTASPLASAREITKRTQHLINPDTGYLMKRIFDGIQNETEILDRACLYQRRAADLERQLSIAV
jgi:hypothetical protein